MPIADAPRWYVEDLADTRFAISPIQETVCSLWALRDPGRYALHLPWRRSVLHRLDAFDTRLLMSLVGESRALPDFLTPRPTTFAPTIEEQLSTLRDTSLDLVRRDLLATHAPGPLPDVLRGLDASGDGPVRALRDALRDLLQHYWDIALKPAWAQIRLVLEADITYRARQLALGGARLLFADLHPNLKVTPSAVSQHLRVLYATGLVTRSRDGPRHPEPRRASSPGAATDDTCCTAAARSATS